MRRWTKSVLVMFLCLLVALPLAAARAHGSRGGSWSGSGDGSGDGPEVRVVRPRQSIQAAIDRAEPGDTILVKPGRYREALVVTTDDLTLKGSRGTVLTPPNDADNPCVGLMGQDEVNGICVLGKATPASEDADAPVENTRISGFTVKGFSGSGILAVDTDGLRVTRNRVKDNDGYGIFALSSTRPLLAGNKASGNGDAGLYVGGEQEVDATVVGNISWDNSIGILLRDVSHGAAVGNVVARNCVGIVLLANAPGPVTDWKVKGNLARRNNKTDCGEGDERVPSGTGILLVGASDNRVSRNLVLGNRGEEPTSGGIVLVSAEAEAEAETQGQAEAEGRAETQDQAEGQAETQGQGYPEAGQPAEEPAEDEAAAPSGNRISKNVALGNRPFDLRWDRTGDGNRFADNRCGRSRPRRLCD